MLFCKLLVIGLAGVAASAAPIVFNATETAGPGDIIGLQGANFGAAPQVWMQHVVGTEASLSPQVQLTVLNGTNMFVSAQIPPTQTLGLYAIWVQDGTNQSSPVFINRARAWGANDLCGTNVDSGRSFRLFGRNLFLPGATPSVWFVNGMTTNFATVTTNGSDAYMLKVTAPTLTPGAVYTIYLQNGFGADYGTTNAAIQLLGRAGGGDPFGLGVPWGADFTFSTNVYNVMTDSRLATHAAGNGANDDTSAIQAAINAASGAGGGVVYFPAGTYKIMISTSSGHALVMASDVVLQGAGTNVSHLLINGAGPATPGYGIEAQNGLSLVGFMNIDIHNLANGGSMGLRCDAGGGAAGVNRLFAVGALFQSDGGENIRCFVSSRILISNCTIASDSLVTNANDGTENVYLSDDADVVFINNTITWESQYEKLMRSVRTLIENNHFTRSTIRSMIISTGGLYPSGSSQIVIHGNTFDKSGPGQFITEIYNDGETILDENSNDQPDMDLGSVTGATSNTLADSAKNWASDIYGTPINSNTGRAYSVAIVNGPGAGQLRRITASTATTLTVNPPWAVVPTGASSFTIQYFGRNYLIDGNNLSWGDRGIWIYAASMQDLSIVNNTLTNGEGIWLRTDYRPTAVPARFNAQFECYVANNSVCDTSNLYAAYIGKSHNLVGTSSDFGTSSFAAEYRNNYILASVPNLGPQFGGPSLLGESYYSTPVGAGSPYPPSPDGATVSHIGTIFDNNSIVNGTNAFDFCTGDYCHVIWNTTTNNVRSLLYDQSGAGAGHPSIGTVIGGSAIGGTPPAPTGLTAAPGSNQISLSWNGVFGATNYFVYRSTTNGGPYAIVESTNGTSWADAGVAAGTTYFYVVTAVNSLNSESAYSAQVSATPANGAGGGTETAMPAFVQQAYASPQTSQTSVSVQFPQSQAAGNANILAVGWNDTSASISSVTDTAGNNYQPAVTTFRGNNLSQAIYCAANIKSGLNTVTANFNQAAVAVDFRVAEYSGLNPTNTFDSGASATGGSTDASSGSLTISGANELLFAAGMTFGGYSGPGPGFTERVITSQDGDIVEDQIGPPAGTTSATAPLNNTAWLMQAAAFRPAQMGGAIVPTQPTLNAQADGNNIVISWNAAWSGVGLQASPSLAPAAWVPVTVAPVLANTQLTVTVPMTNGLEFYRLAR